MGAWGEGMRANDMALDFLPDVEGLPKNKAREAFRASNAWKLPKSYSSRAQAVLGIADQLLEDGHGVPEDLVPKVEEQVEYELGKIREWRDPELRKAALLRFRALLRGEEVDKKELAADNAGLLERIAFSLEQIIEDEEGRTEKRRSSMAYKRKTRDVVCRRCGRPNRIPVGGLMKNYRCMRPNHRRKTCQMCKLVSCQGDFKRKPKED